MQGSENDRLRLFEVPFQVTLSGTMMVLATDDAKAKMQATEALDDPSNFAYSGEDMLFGEDHDDEAAVNLKDEIRISTTILNPSPSSEPLDDRWLFSEEDRAQAQSDTAHTEGATTAPAPQSGLVDSKMVKDEAPSTNPQPAPTAPPKPNPATQGMQQRAPSAPPRPSPATPNPNFPTGTVPGKK